MQAEIPSYIYEYPSEGGFIAHSLTYDLVAHGWTAESAREKLDVMLQVQIQSYRRSNGNPIFPAPIEYWEQMWRAGKGEDNG